MRFLGSGTEQLRTVYTSVRSCLIPSIYLGGFPRSGPEPPQGTSFRNLPTHPQNAMVRLAENSFPGVPPGDSWIFASLEKTAPAKTPDSRLQVPQGTSFQTGMSGPPSANFGWDEVLKFWKIPRTSNGGPENPKR